MKKSENDSIKHPRLIYVLILFTKTTVFSLKHSFQKIFFIEDLNINVYFVNHPTSLHTEVGYVQLAISLFNVYSIVFHFGDCFKQLQCTLLNISENCIVDVHKRTTSFWWNKQDQNIQIESCGIMNNASELIVGKIIENGNVRVAFLIRKAFVNGRMLKRLLWLCCRNLQYNFIIF